MSNIEDTIRQQINSNPIVIYMKGTPDMPMCGFSAATVEVFKHLNADFHTVNVLEDDNIRQGIKSFSNWPTIPQVYIKGEFVGGCDIIREMHLRGELETLVKEALTN